MNGKNAQLKIREEIMFSNIMFVVRNIRLPYFNSVRFCVVDPMHYPFLGVAKWIVTKLWIGEGILNHENLKIMQERADMIKITSDLGRRPVRIATGEGFSNFTADMWKTFIIIFAMPITWDFWMKLIKNPCLFCTCL